MKKIILWIPCILFPMFVFCQKNPNPSDFHGVMAVDENKNIDFTSLTNPTDGTNIAYFTHKPTKEEYLAKKGRKLLSFNKISRIEILPLSNQELLDLINICGDMTLQKATLTLITPDKTIPEVIYLDVKWFEWRSNIMKGFPDTYRMEVRNVDHIEIYH